ncbi:MAG: hypothetical protein LBG50_03240, partial [Clostridiales Family XIII bacterium]|nr:hypothetical protein [Clostridiales Family XIII bacterium]
MSGCSGSAAQNEPSLSAGDEPSAKILLVGEYHGVDWIYNREFEKWSGYYGGDGMRHLFLETPYFTAALLNVWMKSEDDAILDAIYEDWDGTADHNQHKYDFFKRIKEECPETVFHGVDVGHQYFSIGERYLTYLSDAGQGGGEEYRLAEEAITQGKTYYGYESSADADSYREEIMAKNF